MAIRYEILIDGVRVTEVPNDAALARNTALELAEGHRAIAIVVHYRGLAADEGMYWEYQFGTWIYTHPKLATRGAKPKKIAEA